MPYKNFNLYLVALISIFIVSLQLKASKPDREIIHITPPKISKKNLGKRILCYRPMRNEGPCMEIEVINNQVIAHNYGQGGSGWTLGPGCASYVNHLLESSSAAADLTKTSPITIIGAGVLGLFTAYDLIEKGHQNITIMAKSFEDLTSHNAGGLLAPVSMNNSPNMQKLIDKIGIDAYKFYEAIAKKNHNIFSEGAMIIPTYFRNREESGLEPYVGKVMQPAKDVLLDFGNGQTQEMVAYNDGIFIDTGIMMVQLRRYLEEKVSFVQKEVKDFKEIGTKYIINCSGLGAKKLKDDEKLMSVQGHLIMLKNQIPQDLQHMILVYSGVKETNKNGQKIQRSFYIFPKRLPETPNDIGVIGGTFIEGATVDTPNEEEFDIIIKNAKEFYGNSHESGRDGEFGSDPIPESFLSKIHENLGL